MLKLIGWVVGVVLLCWATVSAFSILSELQFLVDGWSWSLGHIPMSTPVGDALLLIGKWVSVTVANYRDFAHGVVAALHLPHLPQLVYDIFGILPFSSGRGLRLSRRRLRKYHEFLGRSPILTSEVIALMRKYGGKVWDKWDHLDDHERALWNRYGQYVDAMTETLKKRFPIMTYLGAIPYYVMDSRHRSFFWRLPNSFRVAVFSLLCILGYDVLVGFVVAALFDIDYLYRHFA